MMMIAKAVRPIRYDRYFLKFDLCVALFVAWLAMYLTDTAKDVRVLAWLAFSLLLLALYGRKRRDEFAEHCWRTATSVTFLMLILAPLTLQFGAGFVDGFMGWPKRTGGDPSFDGLVTFLFATFFATFEWTRFRGGR